MNYRHIYHAGNFADVLKHAVLAQIIDYMKLKAQPFRVIDTHAGSGVYDLSSERAQKTGEWRGGIGRVLDAKLPDDIAAILAPYLGVVREENGGGAIVRYPGSPLLARRLLRHGDVLVVNEPHPEDGAELAALFTRDAAVRCSSLDGWTALKAVLPPKERRGVVLVDPPFEQPGEFNRLLGALAAARRRFATGTVMLWYPIKDTRAVRAFYRDATALAIPKLLSIELFVDTPYADGELTGTGLLIVNPPFTLEATLSRLLPWLVERLARGNGATGTVTWLTGDRITSA